MLYFAYGSNLNQHQMRLRCPDSKFLTIGQLDGYHLYYGGKCSDWGNKAYANIAKSRKNIVWGAIYKLSRSDIKKLDGYENTPIDYTRKQVSVHLKNRTIKAYAYIGSKVKTGRPSKEYEQTVVSGAKSKHLPNAYVATL